MSEDETGGLGAAPRSPSASEPAAPQDPSAMGATGGGDAADDRRAPGDMSGQDSKQSGNSKGLRSDQDKEQVQAAAERRLVYRPSAGQPALWREASDLGRRLCGFLDMVACDTRDRDAQVIFLAARSHGRACAHRFAAALGDPAPLERLDSDGLGSVRPSDVLDAIKAALEEQGAPEPGRARVIIDSLRGAVLDAQLTNSMRGWWHGPGTDYADLGPELKRLSCRLVVHVDLEQGQPLLPVLEDLRDAIVVPWTDLWLMEAARREGLGGDVLAREIGEALRKAAQIVDAESGQREADLHLLLNGEAQSSKDGVPKELKEHIAGCITDSAKGRHAIAQDARAFALQVLRSDDVAAYGGPIGRTLLLTALLIPEQPTRLVLDLCRRLLPQAPAYSECLTAPLLEIWLREVENERSQQQPVGHPPSWGDLFESVCDRVIDKVGLMVGPKQKLKLGGRLAPLDVGACLAEQTGRLVQFTRLLLAQARAVWLPVELLPVLVDLACALRRLEGEPLAAGDLPLLFAGTGSGDGDLGLPNTMPAATPVPEHAAWTLDEMRGRFLAQQAMGVAEEFPEEDLRIFAAGRLRYVLELWRHHPEVDDVAFSAFLEQLGERVSTRSTLTLLAFLVLRGPSVEPLQLGRLTVGSLRIGDHGHFTDAFRYFHGTVKRAMVTATAAGGDTPVAIDAWADALWCAARATPGGTYGRICKALAVWMDDVLSTWEIPYSLSSLDSEERGAVEPCLLSRLMIHEDDASRDDDLLTRLFLCTPEARLEALQTLQGQTSRRDAASPALRVADLVRQRLADVVWIMIGGVDEAEFKQAGLSVKTLETLVWGAIGQFLKLLGMGDQDSAVQEILKAGSSAPQGDTGDPRAALDLYAPAVLFFWHLQRSGTRSLVAETRDDAAFKATLSRLRRVLEPSGHLPRITIACNLLLKVERALMSHFEASGCVRTHDHHAWRLYCLGLISYELTGTRDEASAKEGQS